MSNSSTAKINYFFANLNVIIILIGYPLITSLFIPLTGNIEGSSRLITIPFRILALGISLITLFLNFKKKNEYPLALKLFFLFWILLLLRIFYDLELRSEYSIPDLFKQQVWLFAVGICFIPMVSLAKSIGKIDFELCLKYMYYACCIILVVSFFTTIKSAPTGERLEGNIALDSISFGQAAVTATIIAIYRLITKKNISKVCQIGFIFFSILGVYVALKSGSRSPLLALVIVLLFWFSFKNLKLSKGFLIFISIISLVVFLKKFIVQIIGVISPITAFRLNEGISGNDLSMLNRQESYLWFINKILENPIWGSQFARLSNGEYPGYAHNIFLDILLGFGIVGLGLFLYIIIKALSSIRTNIIEKDNFWIGLLMIQFFVLSITSGAYYSDPILNVTIVLSLLITTNQSKRINEPK
jgi:O-antigen ligase